MTLIATARSIPGTLRQEILIGDEHRLITDQPKELGGDGTGPSPHELLPAALAACVAVTLVQYGRTKGWNLGEMTVDVAYDKGSTPRQVETVIRLDGELTETQLERLEKVARACPLRRSLEAGFEFTERITVWKKEESREQEADRDPGRRYGRHDDGEPAPSPLRPG
jgi:putative redox protein